MNNRGAGTTSKQILEAARGATFVWCNEHLSYATHLAKHLGREDLKVIRPSTATNGYFDGRHGDIVVDHAFWELRSRRDTERMDEILKRQSVRQAAPVA